MALATEPAAAPFRPLCIEGACVKWATPPGGAPRVVTWAIATAPTRTDDAYNCRDLHPPSSLLARSGLHQAEFHGALQAAFASWERAANIVFVERHNEPADILIGEQGEQSGFAFTNVTVGSGPDHNRVITGALVCLNPAKRWKIGYDGNLAVYDLVHTLAHEIGHAIGLDHPEGRNHLMSFRYHESGPGLSEGDMLGAAALYGARRDVGLVLTGSLPQTGDRDAPAERTRR